jgi:hypothetical protein
MGKYKDYAWIYKGVRAEKIKLVNAKTKKHKISYSGWNQARAN